MVEHLMINKQKNRFPFYIFGTYLWRELKKPLGIKPNFEWSTHREDSDRTEENKKFT